MSANVENLKLDGIQVSTVCSFQHGLSVLRVEFRFAPSEIGWSNEQGLHVPSGRHFASSCG